ncbi:hypothetical protein ANTRET_LOCUS5122 [Anthophora retusa]
MKEDGFYEMSNELARKHVSVCVWLVVDMHYGGDDFSFLGLQVCNFVTRIEYFRTRPQLVRIINNPRAHSNFARICFLISTHTKYSEYCAANIPRKIKINQQTALNHNRTRIFEARSIPPDIHPQRVKMLQRNVNKLYFTGNFTFQTKVSNYNTIRTESDIL